MAFRRMAPALFALALAPRPSFPEEHPEVRQLVVFDFLPEKTDEAIRLFHDVLSLYKENTPMLRFRGYREVESPEPLDLIVVSSFSGMGGMDRSNRRLRELARARGTSVGELYGRIAALSRHHRDEFVEMDERLAWGDVEQGSLVVFVSLRLAPGRTEDYRRRLNESVLAWETKLDFVTGSEGGRFLVSDGWSFFRVLGISALGDWHRYLTERRRQPFWSELAPLVVARKETILAPVPELSVR